MKLYRIHTEDKNRERIAQIVGAAFDAWTLLNAEGVWKGQSEHSLVIEVYTESEWMVKAVALQIKEANNQEAVLVSEQEVKETLI